MKLSRRDVLKGGAGIAATLVASKSAALADVSSAPAVIRPPGAKPETSFSKNCIRCFQCGSICPNNAIKSRGLEGGIADFLSPYIDPRDQACMLCMKCTQVCPTDALLKISDDSKAIRKNVKMGTAQVDTSICYSYNGRTCGVCYYACPFPDVSLKLELFAQPVIDSDRCVGCGLCEKACVHIPQAVRVMPRQLLPKQSDV